MIALAAWLAIIADGPHPPPGISRCLAAAAAEEQRLIDDRTKRIDKARRDLRIAKSRKQADRIAELVADIDRWEEEVGRWKASDELLIPLFGEPLGVGQLGLPVAFAVEQIFDEDEILVLARIEGVEADVPVWLKGLPSEGLVDKSPISLERRAFEITGTRTYKSPFGVRKTVPVAEAIDLDAAVLWQEIQLGRPLNRAKDPREFHSPPPLEAASQLLERARAILSRDPGTALAALKTLVERYPGTPSALESQTLIDTLR